MEDGQDTVLGQSTLEKATLVTQPTPMTATLGTSHPGIQTPENSTPPSPGPPPAAGRLGGDTWGRLAAPPGDAPRAGHAGLSPCSPGTTLPATTCRGMPSSSQGTAWLSLPPKLHAQTFHPRPRRSLPGVWVAVASDTHGHGLGSSAAAATVPDRARSGASFCPARAPGVSRASSCR